MIAWKETGGTLSLDGGDWPCKPYGSMDWVWRDAEKPGSRDRLGWLPATVPSSVQHDLWRAAQIVNKQRSWAGHGTLRAEVWANNSREGDAPATLHLALAGLSGHCLYAAHSQPAGCPANAAARLTAVSQRMQDAVSFRHRERVRLRE